GEKVEQQEKARLAAGGQRDVLGRQRPAVLAREEPRERAPERKVAGRMRVVRDHALERGGVVADLGEAAAHERLNGRDLGRITAAEERGVAFAAHRAAEVVHELERAGGTREALAEGGELEADAAHFRDVLTARSGSRPRRHHRARRFVTVMVTRAADQRRSRAAAAAYVSGSAVVSIGLRRTNDECTPITPSMRVILLSRKSWYSSMFGTMILS